jgi:hypothetical protein
VNSCKGDGACEDIATIEDPGTIGNLTNSCIVQELQVGAEVLAQLIIHAMGLRLVILWVITLEALVILLILVMVIDLAVMLQNIMDVSETSRNRAMPMRLAISLEGRRG